MRMYCIMVAGDNDHLHEKWLAETVDDLMAKNASVQDAFVARNIDDLNAKVEQRRPSVDGIA